MLNGRLSSEQLLVCAVIALGSFCYGYSVNIASSTLAQPAFQAYFRLDSSPRATAIVSAVGVAPFVGAAIITPFIPWGADKYGRKFNFYVYSILLIIGGALQAGSVNAAMFISTRVLIGIACGALFTCVPMYQSEVAPAHLRGALIACHGTLFCLGSWVSQWLNFSFFFTQGAVSWRTPLAIQVIFPLIVLGVLRFVPESPRFLITIGRHEEALVILRRLHGTQGDDNGPVVAQEYQAIVTMESHSKDHDDSWSALFSTKANFKRTFTAGFVTFFYAWTGINVISVYIGTLLEGLGMKPVEQLALIAGMITSNIFSGFFIDRIGRKLSLYISLAICTISLIINTVVLFKFDSFQKGRAVGVFSIWLYYVGFTAFYDVPCWCYAAEIWPQHLRAKGFSLSLFLFFIGNIITVGAAPTAFANIGNWFYLLFIGLMLFIALPVFYFLFPETTGVKLEDMGTLFEHCASPNIENVMLGSVGDPAEKCK